MGPSSAPAPPYEAVVRVASAIAVLVGGLWLLFWVAGLAPRWSAAVVTVKTNAALCMCVAGLSLRLLAGARSGWRRAAGTVAAAFVLLVAAATLSEHILRVDLGIDQLLVTEPAGALATASPNRMGPPGSTAFVLLASGLLALAWRRRAAPYFGIAVCTVVLVPAVGHLLGIGDLYGLKRNVAGIAWPTVLVLLALGSALVAAVRESGPAAILARDDAGGDFARGTMPAAILVPVAIGFLATQGQRHGLYEADFGIGILVIGLVLTLSMILWASARHVSRLSAARERDVEALRQLTRELQDANERLREADRRKDEFLAVLSHELRNPLAPIRSSVTVMERAEPGETRARRALSVIGRQVDHLSRLVNDLLDATRISRGGVRLAPAPLLLNAVLRDAEEDFRELFRARGVELRTELPEHPLRVLGDPTRVAQMVGNLLQNAAKFTPRGGRTTLSLSEERGHAVIRVSDTGPGIDDSVLGKVFEPFVQAERTLERSRGGLGLGLALVKGLAEAHGGSVGAASAGPQGGALFTLRLPLHEGPAAEAPAAPSPRERAPGRVLLIEDNVDAAESLRDLLELEGHCVTLAHDGAEGLIRAREVRPQVVLCDIGLPGIDGYEVARALRADPALRSAVLVALTGNAMPTDVERCLDAGFDRHLSKPAPVPALLRAVEEAVAQSECAQPLPAG